MSFPVTCPRCNGTGTDPEGRPDALDGEDCLACRGDGIIEDPTEDVTEQDPHVSEIRSSQG